MSDQPKSAHLDLGDWSVQGRASTALPVCADLRQTFDTETELSLEVYHDPEIDDSYLTIYVRREAYEPDIMDQIERVSRKFDDVFSKIQGYILITTDFRRPRGNDA